MFITLKEASGLCPKQPSVKTLRRRISKGINGVRLKATRDGGQWFTTAEWIREFQDSLTAASLEPAPLPARLAPVRTPGRVKKQLAARFGIHGAK